ncbi:MAG: hypothetical protein ABII18_07345 [bacterium]|nr:hypothetical protein [bacterium]MBU1917445.1 hypothetical protein [bacterium]
MIKRNQIDNLKKSLFLQGITNVQVIETHLSWVLLTGKCAYKIKKEVKFPFVDFSTLAKRKHYYYEELKLNQRYSPDVYLDVLEIKKHNHQLSIGSEEGFVVEYALKMVQLPHLSRLDVVIENNQIQQKMLFELVDVVINFHKKTKKVSDSLYASPDMIQGYVNNLQNFRIPFEKEFRLGKTVDQILLACNHFLKENRNLFIQRQQKGFIRECHGDLHTRNIYYIKKPVLTDCIEFNNDLRKVDIALDISFLIMDLEARGLWKYTKDLTEYYVSCFEKADFEKLIIFYKCWMSSVRALVSMMNAKDLVDKKKRYSLLHESKHFLKLSHLYVQELNTAYKRRCA